MSHVSFFWSVGNNFGSDLAKKINKKHQDFFKVILILPPVWLLNLGSDLSINNIVQLDSADTKNVSQDAVNKVLELMEKWKYPNFRGKF